MSEQKQPVICTIFAKNYVAFARTLCDSFLEHHPEGKCFALIIDDFSGYITPADEKFEIITPELLEIPRLREFCFKYNITELSTAFKPYLLRFLLATRKLDKLLYIDPDILINRRLDALYSALDHHDMIVTPHLDADYPDDGSYPDDGHILSTGIYNLGFFGVRNGETGGKFLDWWCRKLYDKCVNKPRRGYFVDQRFIDYALPLFNGFGFIRDLGYNVAYWNLHSRKITLENGEWRCNGGPLYFYHFSNYKPEKPDSISGHQWRYSFNDLPDLKKLFSRYRELLTKNGYDKSRTWKYDYGRFKNGTRISDLHRRTYRNTRTSIGCEDPFSMNPVVLLAAGARWFIKKAFKRLRGDRTA
jgi:hypothetical protein